MNVGDIAYVAFNYSHTQGVEQVKLVRRTPMSWRFVTSNGVDWLVMDKTRDRKIFATREEAHAWIATSLLKSERAAQYAYLRAKKRREQWWQRREKVLHPSCIREIQENV